jgi:hypothetical protein
MDHVVEHVVPNERPFATYAQPLSRLQVSWGSVLAGTITMLAVSLILWVLALAIIFTAAQPSMNSLANSVVAGWVTAMIAILIGALIGGMVAGYLPGNPRRLITCAHGFLAWCVAFLLAAAVQWSVLSGVTKTATSALVTTATTAVQTTGTAVGSVAGGATSLDRRARDLLISLGYAPSEAEQLVASAQRDLQRALHGGVAPDTAGAKAKARGALDTLLDWTAIYTWLWFAVWAAAAGLSVLGASLVLGRVREVPVKERASMNELASAPPDRMHPVGHAP